jgi:hypothetical protein
VDGHCWSQLKKSIIRPKEYIKWRFVSLWYLLF